MFTIYNFNLTNVFLGNSLAVQWLGLSTFTVDQGSTPGQGTKILEAKWCSARKKIKNNKKRFSFLMLMF